MEEDERILYSSKRVWLCGIAQFTIAYAFAFLFTAPLAKLLRDGMHPVFAFMILGATAEPILLVLPFLAKWIMIGKYRAGKYPLWGLYYIRFWLVARLMAVSPLPFLSGTPFLALYMRLLGARIGRGCHLASGRLHLPDLIEIGDEVSIGYGAAIETYVVRNGWLYLEPIRIEKEAFIGAGAVLLPGSKVGEGAMILEQSLVGEGQVIPDKETWSGSPSRKVSPDPVLEEMGSFSASVPCKWSCSLICGFTLVLLVFFMAILPALILGPSVLLLWLISDGDFYRMTVYSPITGPTFVLSVCFAVALSKKAIMHKTSRGISPLRSLFGLRKWAADNLMMISLGLTNSLYATLYAIPFLRALGARIDSRSEGKYILP
jgi:non-ribosomal peptide synthetase-like protein